jgi:hypothetical protein
VARKGRGGTDTGPHPTWRGRAMGPAGQAPSMPIGGRLRRREVGRAARRCGLGSGQEGSRGWEVGAGSGGQRCRERCRAVGRDSRQPAAWPMHTTRQGSALSASGPGRPLTRPMPHRRAVPCRVASRCAGAVSYRVGVLLGRAASCRAASCRAASCRVVPCRVVPCRTALHRAGWVAPVGPRRAALGCAVPQWSGRAVAVPCRAALWSGRVGSWRPVRDVLRSVVSGEEAGGGADTSVPPPAGVISGRAA